MKKSKRQSKRILKAYGKALRKSRVAYMTGIESTHETVNAFTYSRPRLHLRRVIIVVLIAIMMFSATIIVCDALGIHLFNFQIFNKIGHAILINQDKNDGQSFYRPKYVIRGYELDDVISPSDVMRTYSYKRKGENLYYTVDETVSKDTRIDVNTEDQEIEKLVYNEIEIRVFRDKKYGTITAYMLYDGTYISISGNLTKQQIFKIIDGLEPDK